MDLESAIARAQQGDSGSYGAVVHEFQGRLRAFIAAYVPSHDQVDELAQRAFVWAFEHLDRYEPGTRFYTWLKSITRNVMLAELEAQKREARSRRKYLDHLLATRCADELATQASETRRELADRLQNCLKELSDDSQSLLRRRYEQHERVQEIARSLKRTESAVKVAIFRIRQSLKRCIERDHAALSGA